MIARNSVAHYSRKLFEEKDEDLMVLVFFGYTVERTIKQDGLISPHISFDNSVIHYSIETGKIKGWKDLKKKHCSLCHKALTVQSVQKP